jgi:ketosteroid isomerase-like protein
MSTEATAQAVKNWYDNFAKWNFDAVINGLAEDVEWDAPANEHNKILPFVGKRIGRAQVAEALQKRGATCTVEALEIRDLVCQDDRAFVVVYTRGTCRATGKVFEIEDAHRIVVRADGKIAKWKAYWDSILVAAAFIPG